VNLAANVTPADFSSGITDNALSAALLMQHCTGAHAFMHLSTAALYTPPEDPLTPLTEEDLVGAKAEGFYSGSKIASEGAVRAMAHFLRMPTIQLRPSVHYGTHADGGLLIAIFLNSMINNIPIEIFQDRPTYFSAISESDVNLFLEPLLNAASTDAPVVNLVSDEQMNVEEVVVYMGELTGLEPQFQPVSELSWPALIISPEKRRDITGPSERPWKDGVKDLVEFWYPKLREETLMSPIAAGVSGAGSQSSAKYTPETRVKEISSLPGIVEFLTEHTGQKVAPFALKIGASMTLQKAGTYLKWTTDDVQRVVDQLNHRYQ
jgi:nucleoside-diphosphate-sugar epimerase